MPCDRTTRSCIESIKNVKPLPECCQEHLTVMTKRLAAIFNNAGLHYWLDWGSLLGIIRDGKLIPYDKDIDFSIFYKDLPLLKKLVGQINKKHFFCPRACLGYARQIESSGPRVFYSKINHTFSDIFMWKQFSKKQYANYYNLYDAGKNITNMCPKTFFDNLSSVEFEGITIKTPSNTEKYLELRYGPNWRTPDPHFYKNGGHAIRRKQMAKYKI